MPWLVPSDVFRALRHRFDVCRNPPPLPPVMHIPGPSVASAFISVHWIAADVARSGVPTTVLPIIHPALITQAKHVSFSGGRCSDTKSVDKATIKVRGRTRYCPYIAAFRHFIFERGGREKNRDPSIMAEASSPSPEGPRDGQNGEVQRVSNSQKVSKKEVGAANLQARTGVS